MPFFRGILVYENFYRGRSHQSNAHVGPDRLLLSVAVGVALVLAAIGALAVADPFTGLPSQPAEGTPAVPEESSDLAAVHAAGISGANVTVGVVDVTGFDTTRPVLSDRVVAARSFAPGETVRNGGRTGHGTAAASVVARTAPDSDLYLATFDTADGYEAAVRWLIEADVDVVVAPVTFYGKPRDGTSNVAMVARRAAARGVVFVAPSGNLARGHWTGRYRPTEDGVHQFDGGTRNYIRTSGDTRLRLWLSWDRRHRSEDYTAELYWTNGTERRLVARSQPYPADGLPNERVVARVGDGTYYVRVTGPENATDARITVESPTHALQFRSSGRSIAAPATAPRVLTVGAYDRAESSVAPFSSAGPTRDGRVGVDAVAPETHTTATDPDGFTGSSAAAAYTAGTAALVLDAGSDHTPRAVERLLERTADRIRETTPHPRIGYGRLRPARAVRAARNRSNQD